MGLAVGNFCCVPDPHPIPQYLVVVTSGSGILRSLDNPASVHVHSGIYYLYIAISIYSGGNTVRI